MEISSVVEKFIVLGFLEQEEASLAQVLLKHNLLKEEDMNRFLSNRATRRTTGKKLIGGVLIDLGYITQADIDAYLAENHEAHVAFLRKMTDGGYLTPEQAEIVLRKAEEIGSDVVTAICNINIMTRDNYIRIFNKQTSILRMGEWLVSEKKKITREQLNYALEAQGINAFDDYLKFYNLVHPTVVDKIKEKLAN